MTVIAIYKDNDIHQLNNDDFKRCTGESILGFIQRKRPRPKYTPKNFRQQLDYISDKFYSVSGQGNSLVYKMRQSNKDAIKVSKKALIDTVYRHFKGDIEDLLLIDNMLLWFVPACLGEVYAPCTKHLYLDKDAERYANTYQPSKYIKQKDTYTVPTIFKEYLDRIMPPENKCWFRNNQNFVLLQQAWFVQFIAQRIQQPHIAPEVAIILRGDQGTGKSFIFDIVLRELLGESNYTSVPISKITDKFKANLWSKCLIQVEELDDTKNKVSDQMKQLTTQKYQMVEQKYQASYQAEKHFGIVITSNAPIPLVIEQNDRRYFIPDYSKVTDDTQSFFQRFADWLNYENGYQQICDYLMSLDISDFDIRKAPITAEKLEMMSNRTASEDKQHIAYVVVMDNKNALFMPQMLNEHFKFGIPIAQRVLKDAGFEPYQNKKRWIKGARPIKAWKHKDEKKPNRIWLGMNKLYFINDGIDINEFIKLPK